MLINSYKGMVMKEYQKTHTEWNIIIPWVSPCKGPVWSGFAIPLHIPLMIPVEHLYTRQHWKFPTVGFCRAPYIGEYPSQKTGGMMFCLLLKSGRVSPIMKYKVVLS
jgi:hypothetical protein